MSHDCSEPEDAIGREENNIKSESAKKSSRVTKSESSFAELLEEISELHRDMKTSEEPINPLLQELLSLSTNTIKDTFYRLGGKISEFSDHKK